MLVRFTLCFNSSGGAELINAAPFCHQSQMEEFFSIFKAIATCSGFTTRSPTGFWFLRVLQWVKEGSQSDKQVLMCTFPVPLLMHKSLHFRGYYCNFYSPTLIWQLQTLVNGALKRQYLGISVESIQQSSRMINRMWLNVKFYHLFYWGERANTASSSHPRSRALVLAV